MNELELLNQLQDYWKISICVGIVMVVISIGISFIVKKDIPKDIPPVSMEALHNMSIPHTHNNDSLHRIPRIDERGKGN